VVAGGDAHGLGFLADAAIEMIAPHAAFDRGCAMAGSKAARKGSVLPERRSPPSGGQEPPLNRLTAAHRWISRDPEVEFPIPWKKSARDGPLPSSGESLKPRFGFIGSETEPSQKKPQGTLVPGLRYTKTRA
jgi:hypothetical protein